MKPERINSTKVASILGVTVQTVLQIAARGQLSPALSAVICSAQEPFD